MVGRIAIEPGDPGTIYCVVRPDSGGVGLFRSSNAGTPTEDWVSIVDQLQQSDPEIDPSCVAVNPVTPSTIYVGTWGYQSIFISLDRGAHWGPPLSVGARIRKLVVDPRTAGNPATTVLFAATDQGLFRSGDSGATWTNVLSGDVRSFSAFMPQMGTDVYYAGVLRSGLFTATDPTGPWTNLNNQNIGLPPYDAMAPGGENFHVVYADLCPLNPSRVYVVLLSGADASGNAVYTFGPPLTQWTKVASAVAQPNCYGFDPFFGVYDFAFAVAPNSPGDGMNDILFFCGVKLSRSTDGGNSWEVSPEPLHEDHHDVVFYPANPPVGTIPTVYFGCDGGLGASDGYCDPSVDISVTPADNDEMDTYVDDASMQNYNHGLSSLGIYAYASHPSLPALQYTGAQDTGVAAGAKSQVWRELVEADAPNIAVAPGADGIKVWFESGVNTTWAGYNLQLGTDQGGHIFSPTAVLSASGQTVKSTSPIVTTSDGRCLLGMWSLDMNVSPGPGNPVRSTVGLIDQAGTATRISQEFGYPTFVGLVCVTQIGADVGYCATSDGRLWTTPSIAAATPATVWSEISGSKPAGLALCGIAIDAAGSLYVLADSPVSVGALSTPLFSVVGNAWVAQTCTGVPSGTPFAMMRADPVTPGVLYACAGAKVYKLTLTAGTWNWLDISDDLPGQPINDMWISNIGTASAPVVLLRLAISTRGVWELNVAAPPGPLPIWLYLRDNVLDQGLLPASPDFVPSPYAPADPTQQIVHYESIDIKVDTRQVPGGATPAFFQTDPEGGTVPISSIAFECINDNSQNLPSMDAARVSVQVHNASRVKADALAWAVYAHAAGHPPSLAASPSKGNNYPFWSQFTVSGGVASITPGLPSDSPWTAIGSPIPLSGIDAEHPGIATWDWNVPMLPIGDPGHYCIMAFVHSAQNPLVETQYVVDTVTPINRLVAQKNLHVGPPLPQGPVPPGMKHASMGEYVELNNPFPILMEFDLFFDFRSLPPELEARLQFTELKTVRPLNESTFGIRSSRRGSLFTLPRKAGSLQGSRTLFPRFVDRVYEAHPSTRVVVLGVRIPAFGKEAAFLTVTNKGRLQPGSQYRFRVEQQGIERTVGGSTYIVRITRSA